MSAGPGRLLARRVPAWLACLYYLCPRGLRRAVAAIAVVRVIGENGQLPCPARSDAPGGAAIAAGNARAGRACPGTCSRNPCMRQVPRAGRAKRSRPDGDRGAGSAETVIAVPLLMLLILLIIQFAIWEHAESIAHATAEEALAAARVQGGTAAAGQQRAAQVISQTGSSVLSGPQVSVTMTPADVTVEVTGTAERVLPVARSQLPGHRHRHRAGRAVRPRHRARVTAVARPARPRARRPVPGAGHRRLPSWCWSPRSWSSCCCSRSPPAAWSGPARRRQRRPAGRPRRVPGPHARRRQRPGNPGRAGSARRAVRHLRSRRHHPGHRRLRARRPGHRPGVLHGPPVRT